MYVHGVDLKIWSGNEVPLFELIGGDGEVARVPGSRAEMTFSRNTTKFSREHIFGAGGRMKLRSSSTMAEQHATER